MANNSSLTYNSIKENPYNDLLERSESVVGDDKSEREDGFDYSTDSIDGNQLDNITIDTWIRSRNYKPKTQGFFIDGRTGFIEAVEISLGSLMNMKENDIYLYDDTTGGTTPVTGNTATINFLRSDDETQIFQMQKRSSANDDDGNVFEMFFNKDASGSGKNYIFLGTPGDVAKNLAKTDILQVVTAAQMNIALTNGWDTSASEGVNLITCYNTEEIVGLNSGGTGMAFQVNQADTDNDWSDGTAIFFNVYDNGSTTSSKTWALFDKNGFSLVSASQGQIGLLGVDNTTGDLEWNGATVITGSAGDLWSDPVDSNIVPDGNNTRDLGTGSASFRTLWVDKVNFDNATNPTLNVDGMMIYHTTTDNMRFQAGGTDYNIDRTAV